VPSHPGLDPAGAHPGFDRLLADFSTTLVECPVDAIPGHLAAAIGQGARFFGLDHGWLAQSAPEGGGAVTISFAWVGASCSPTPAFDAGEGLPWISARLDGGARVCLASPDDLPPEAAADRAFLERTGIRSILGLPLVVGGTPLGWLAFGAGGGGRSWSPSVVEALSQLAAKIASGLGHARAERALGRAIEFDQAIAGLAASLIHVPVEAIDAQIVRTLATVGALLGADRASVIEHIPGERMLTRTHLWVRAGTIGPPVSFSEEMFPWLVARVIRGRELVTVAQLDDLPPEAARDRASLEHFGTASGAVAPMVIEDRVVGLLVLGAASPQRWSPDLVARLRLVGEIISSALGRRDTERALRATLAENEQLRERLEAENLYLKAELGESPEFGEIVGRSAALRRALARVGQVADTGAPVLLLGETGTGKELLARAVHSRGQRARQPFIAVNCAALPSTLIESELYGYERGAFTGANQAKAGRFELADRGTLLLDEIGELEPALQVKLLRVLEDGEIQRLGATGTRKVDVRIIAATNRDLRRDVREGRFRSDLYYRLAVFPIQVPPLRDRREDIPLLVWHFIQSRQRSLNRTIAKIPRTVMAALQAYDWPGNVRELQNVIERAMILSRGSVLRVDEALGPVAELRDEAGRLAPIESLQDVERAHILRVLDGCRWTIEGRGQAAERLGLNPSTLRNRMRKLRITRPAR
jgi:transcriptional regulator with GAF, ATPase, and Fis domain